MDKQLYNEEEEKKTVTEKLITQANLMFWSIMSFELTGELIDCV